LAFADQRLDELGGIVILFDNKAEKQNSAWLLFALPRGLGPSLGLVKIT